MSRCVKIYVTRPHRGPQLLPRQLAVLLQLLQPRRLQLRRALLARQTVYQHLQQTRVNISRVNTRASNEGSRIFQITEKAPTYY